MRLTRSLALAAFVAGLTVIVAQASGADEKAAAKLAAKAELKKKRLEAKAALEAAAAKAAAPSPAATPTPAPVAKSAVVVKATAAGNPAALAKIIDTHVARALAEAKMAPSAVCSDEEFLRRVYLDISGVIPTAAQTRVFLDSTNPDKRAKLVDELLAGTNYGRHQADIWVPKLFPTDSNNRFVLKEPFAKWLAESFNKNTPWDQFVTQMVTATGTVEDNPATTFFLANRQVDKLTDCVSQYFLGIQLACAQCHNHPFTGWKQTEYWGMATFFSKVQPDRPKNGNKGGDNSKIGVNEGNGRTKLKDFFPEATKVVPAKFLGGPEPRVADRDPYRPVLAQWMTAADNPYFAKAMVNRTWAQFFGRGFVNPIDDMHEGNEPSHPQLLAALGAEFAGAGFDLKHLIRGICNSQTYQRTSKPTDGNKDDHELFSHMAVKVMTPEMLFDSLQTATGKMDDGTKTRPAGNTKGQPNGAREKFVAFFLAGADMANQAEYEAGIPQALRLMNAPQLAGGKGKPSAAAVPSGKPEAVIESIYLAALSRKPTAAELDRLTKYVAGAATTAEAYADIQWAVLNSSEFTLVR